MAFVDYYKILGVDKNIPQKDVRAAYRKRAKQFHPDLHPNDPKAKAKFQALNEAYDVISDPDKRAKYDQYGEQWKNAQAYEQAGGGAGGFGGFGGFGGNVRDDFGAGGCNGGCGGNARHSTGEMNMNVNIDMYTALLGGEGIVKLSNGSKIKLKIKPETQNGTKVRVRGKGYDRGDGTFGDLIITYNVKLPTGLTERQKELLKEMKEAK